MDVDFTEKFIQAVRNRPILYSQYHPDNKNNNKKMQAWREIQRELNKEVGVLKAKWKNLKDTYKKYKQSRLVTSSQAARKLQNWAWADVMTFIEPSDTPYETEDSKQFLYVQPGNSPTHATTSEEETKDVLTNTQEYRPQGTKRKINVKQRRNYRNPKVKKIQNLQSRRKVRNTSDEKVDVKCDGVDLLFLGYADTFKKLSKRKQVNVKFNMARILMEAELSDLDNATSEISPQ